MTRILFVCMGNICRSPTAEGVMRSLVREAGLEDEIEIDSAGTGDWHAGDPPDRRATAAARRARDRARGRGAKGDRRATSTDFDLLLAMDRENLQRPARAGARRRGAAKIRLLREFDPASPARRDLDVPDPYYGGPQGFEDGARPGRGRVPRPAR